MITLKTDIKQFTHIVHLADIQIRLTKRHDEYREVFSKLFESIKGTPETTVICVVGDIVHSKLDLSPECVQVTKEFLCGLSDIRPTIIVAGNHDTNLTNKNRLDSLSPIVEAIGHSNLHILRRQIYTHLGIFVSIIIVFLMMNHFILKEIKYHRFIEMNISILFAFFMEL